MAVGAFTDALGQLDQVMDAGSFDPVACKDAFYAVAKALVPGAKANDLRRMMTHCMTVMGLGSGPSPVVANTNISRSLGWAVQECIGTLIIDKQGRNRDYVQSGITRRLALGRAIEEWDHEAPLPLPNIPLDLDQATTLLAPYLAHLETQLDESPLAHISLCWEVFEFPAPPFDTVFDQWLTELDARGGTDGRIAIKRAMALATLAEEGRQRLSWPDCEKELLPQLVDPHPLVAAAAGRYLGMLYSGPDEMFVFSTPLPLRDMLERLSVLPVNRRVVAGGFLQGYDVGMDGPFGALRTEAALQGFDVDDWAHDILSQSGVEPYLPSAQAFWFFVHEGYCFDPVFVGRMIDAGHLWEAMMTATEMHQRVEGMQPILERLAALDDADVSQPAQRWLDLHYQGTDTV